MLAILACTAALGFSALRASGGARLVAIHATCFATPSSVRDRSIAARGGAGVPHDNPVALDGQSRHCLGLPPPPCSEPPPPSSCSSSSAQAMTTIVPAASLLRRQCLRGSHCR